MKKGRFSVGVGRQYSGTLGRVDNCQVGVSVNAAGDRASCPLDWRIFLPEAWDEDEERRRKAHVPDAVCHREKWRLALDMIDELTEWRLRCPLALTDAGLPADTDPRTLVRLAKLRWRIEHDYRELKDALGRSRRCR